MSGNLKSFDEMKKILTEKLDKYLGLYGLDKIQYNKSVDVVLGMTFDQLKNLDKQGCDEYSYLLAQHSLVITKAINRERAIKTWADSELDKIVAQQAGNYGYSDKSYIKYELVKNRIINGDGGAIILHETSVASDLKINQLNDVAYKLEFMSKILSNISRSK